MKAECNVVTSVRRQGERSEMKHLLLCAVTEVTEWKESSECSRRNDWNEVTGGTETFIGMFAWEYKRQMYPRNIMKSWFYRVVHRLLFE